MSTYVQADRQATVSTPLGPDALLLRGLAGREAISELFRYELDLRAEHGVRVPFARLLGQPVVASLTLADDSRRHFSGICCRIAEVGRDATFTHYRVEVVPELWYLSRRVQSRVFQHRSVPTILREVLAGLKVEFRLERRYEERNYCVQYRESDFAFASRLMEEEGIHYFFLHSADRHTLIVTDAPHGHPEVGGPSPVWFRDLEDDQGDPGRISRWEKAQELRPGLVTLRDYCFEMPGHRLESGARLGDEVEAGEVGHALAVGRNDRLEVFDYPGGFAHHFDGIDAAAHERPRELEKIPADGDLAAALRIRQEAVQCLTVRGAAECGHFVAGHRFALAGHAHADGEYLLTAVEHRVRLHGDYRSGSGSGAMDYQNTFACIPAAVPYYPPRATPRPVIHGTQTAVVVGPSDEEIFTDKYGRVKVRFRWDRAGRENPDGSCWIRVGTAWAGRGWGAIHIPRVGQEVVVAFEEGDPDRPIIVGSVYNAEQMPPYPLPGGKVVSGVKSNSTPGGGGYNELSFDDSKGREKVTVHAQYDMATTVRHDDTQSVGHDRKIQVQGIQNEAVKGAVSEAYGDTQSTIVKKQILVVSQEANIQVVAAKEIVLNTGKSTLLMKQDGTIQLVGKDVTIAGTSTVRVEAPTIDVVGGKELTVGVDTQTVKADKAKLTAGGKAIAVAAQGTNEIKGCLVKIN
jgi:type VI secretion system secreted protein VgrG